MPVTDTNISIGRWYRFDSPEVEAAYQDSEVRLDLERARYMIWLICLGAIIFLWQDFIIFGRSFKLFVSLGTRVAVLAYNGFALWSLRRPTPERLEKWMIGLAAILSFLVLFGYNSRPLERMNHSMNVLLVVAFAIVVPMRFSIQMFSSSILAVATYLLLLRKHPDSFIATGVLFVLTLALVLGYITSSSFHRVRRQRFAAHQSEIRLRRQLESAMAEIKTLQGLLPICAACKKIRQDDDSWKQIDEYIAEHTSTQFTHGICPDCRQRLYPKYSGENI